MQNLSIFKDISSGDRDRMIHCFGVRNQHFTAGQQILTYSPGMDNVCVLQKGKAHLYCIDEDGDFSLLEQLKENDVFGEMFYLPMATVEYIVEADSDCEVLFISFDRVIHPCQNSCYHHSQLINNLFFLSSQKLRSLSTHINILMQKTVREKLLAYLEYTQRSMGKSEFKLDLSLTDLAAYLNVDRISLMRAIRKLNDEGIIQSSSNKFKLPTS